MRQLLRYCLFLSLLAGAGSVNTQAQVPSAAWCPPGATWTYGWGELTAAGFVRVRYAGDTVVAGYVAQKLARTRTYTHSQFPGATGGPYPLPPVLMRATADQVFVWVGGQFRLLYDFSARPGDTWPAIGVAGASLACLQNPVQVIVDSVGTSTVAGRRLRWLAVRLAPAPWPTGGWWGQRIYEGIGNLMSLQPRGQCGGTDPGDLGPLQSFTAPGWPTLGVGGPGRPPLITLAAAPGRVANAAFEVAPNPSTGRLSLTLPPGWPAPATLTLLDALGRRVWGGPLPPARTLDLPAGAKGLYWLRLEAPAAPPLLRRVLVE